MANSAEPSLKNKHKSQTRSQTTLGDKTMASANEWAPAIGIALIVIAVGVLWIGIEIYLIRQSLNARAARATLQRDRINAYDSAAAATLRKQHDAGIVRRS